MKKVHKLSPQEKNNKFILDKEIFGSYPVGHQFDGIEMILPDGTTISGSEYQGYDSSGKTEIKKYNIDQPSRVNGFGQFFSHEEVKDLIGSIEIVEIEIKDNIIYLYPVLADSSMISEEFVEELLW